MTATILVVDDLETNVKLLEAKLLSEYYTVLTASGGQEALDQLANHRVDIVLLDVMMPGMDGFEACKKIKTDPATLHIPVVMVTALSGLEDKVKALEAGADEFLTKPVNDIALFARVKSLSRIRESVDELRERNKVNEASGGKIVDLNDNFQDSKILLIDDDVVQARNIVRTLSKITQNVTSVETGTEGENIAKDIIPDVVIVSCQIEEGDPLRIAVMLKNLTELSKSSIMFLAEEENMSMVMKGFELGINDYFIYPVDENELLARVKTQLRRKKYQDELRHDLEETVSLATKDGLTGLSNRRSFDTQLENVVEAFNSSNEIFSVIMIDMDHFKIVNDDYGHQAGDEVLKALSEILQKKIRGEDFVARYGGEEFVVLLQGTTISESYVVAERIRAAVEKTNFKISAQEEPLKKTLSMGIAEVREGETGNNVLERADEALYEAKETGRNKVILAKNADGTSPEISDVKPDQKEVGEQVVTSPVQPAAPVETETKSVIENNEVKAEVSEQVVTSPVQPAAPVETETKSVIENNEVKAEVSEQVVTSPIQPAAPVEAQIKPVLNEVNQSEFTGIEEVKEISYELSKLQMNENKSQLESNLTDDDNVSEKLSKVAIKLSEVAKEMSEFASAVSKNNKVE